jgi:hypothetical protein
MVLIKTMGNLSLKKRFPNRVPQYKTFVESYLLCIWGNGGLGNLFKTFRPGGGCWRWQLDSLYIIFFPINI